MFKTMPAYFYLFMRNMIADKNLACGKLEDQ